MKDVIFSNKIIKHKIGKNGHVIESKEEAVEIKPVEETEDKPKKSKKSKKSKKE